MQGESFPLNIYAAYMLLCDLLDVKLICLFFLINIFLFTCLIGLEREENYTVELKFKSKQIMIYHYIIGCV